MSDQHTATTTTPTTPTPAARPGRRRKGKPTRRAPRGGGSVFYSAGKDRWVWKAVIGHKPDGSVRYKQGEARTQADALRRKQDAERARLQPHADRETVADHLNHWLYDVAKPNTRENTWIRYEQVVRLHLAPRVGGIPLRQLRVSHVTSLWAEMTRDGVSAGNIKKCAQVLGSALQVAVAEEKIPVSPTRGAAKPKVIRGDVDVFTDDEVRAILKASRGDRLEALYKVAVGTGARQGELLALEPADFDLAAGTVRINKMLDYHSGTFKVQPPKSKNGYRTIRLPAFAVDAVRLHLAARPAHFTGPVFCTRVGTFMSRSAFQTRDWEPLLAAAKVRYRKFHTLRHTHASRLLADGVDTAEVAKRIGDRIETVMAIYAHWIPTAGRDTAGRLNAIYTADAAESPGTAATTPGLRIVQGA